MFLHVATSRARRAPSDGGFGAYGGSHEGPLFAPDLGYEAFAAASATAVTDNSVPTPAMPADGALTNGMPPGQCFADIVAGVVKSIDVPLLAGTVAVDLARGAPVQQIVANAALEVTVSGVHGGLQAAKASEACQRLDNAHEVNVLGVSAIIAA